MAKKKVKRRAKRKAKAPDALNPAHYRTGTALQSINVIEAFGLDFADGNAVKYILRAGKKDGDAGSVDRRKAIWYLLRKEQRLTGKVPVINIDAPLTV